MTAEHGTEVATIGRRFVGTPRIGVRTAEYGRDYRLGYGVQVRKKGVRSGFSSASRPNGGSAPSSGS